ncbi:MAG: glycosyl hydrolase family 95 catalytic domain-containing protein, partial [Planctomycetaceae bacterium]
MIEVGGQPFAADKGNFRQQLSLETAECILETTDIVARMFVSANSDVLVLELDDRRDAPQPLQIAVSMLRQPEVRVGENFASTGFVDNPKQVVLHQRFRERDFHNASALVVSVSRNDAAENKTAQIVPTSATTRTLILPPAHGKRVLLISSAASRQATDDPSARAASLFENAASQSVTELREAHQKWWRDFWSRTFVDLSSDDGQAQRAQRWRDLHLYHVASSSRGELSPRAKGLCQFDSQLNVVTEPYKGRFSWISHVASSGSELAIHAWCRHRYTGDQNWLRTHTYPLLRGTVEFYRHLVRKEADGRYHLSGTHAHEDFWGVRDSIMDLAAIRGTAPLAIRAAEILGVAPDLRDQWKELLENLAPYPVGSDPHAKALTGGALAEDVWAAGFLGEMDGQHNPEDVWLTPVFPFEECTLETRNVVTDPIVQKLLDLAP